MPVGAGFIPARIGENKKMTEHKKLQPEIRFAGFTDDWEQRKLGTCGNIITGNTPSTKNKLNYTDNGLLWVTPTDIKSNITTKTANTLSEEGKKLARTLPKNSILVTCIASIGKNTLILEEASCNQQINALVPNNNHDPYFLLTYSFIWSEKMKLIAGAGTMDIVNKTQFSDILCAFPSLEEQTQIGNFFKQLDDTIALHQGTLEKYQKLKISYLEKMFPKGNERYPELRFPNFTDAWEQRKLGEVVNVLDNLRIPIAASQRLEGVTPYYGANGIQGYIDGFTHDGEFVLVAEDGANDLINYPVQYVSGKVWINNHAHVLQGIKNVANNLFLVYRIKSMDITKYLVGGGRTKLNASVMKGIELHLPNYAEQTQIGNFFKQLDDTIALHQKELAKYQQIKAACLEKMFVE